MNLHVRLTPDQCVAGEQIRHDRSLPTQNCDRVEIALLSDSGWTVTAIATQMSWCLSSVRWLTHRIDQIGIDASQRRHTGPAPDVSLRETVEAALTAPLRGTQCPWSAPQLSVDLHEARILLSKRRICRFLLRMGAGYRRVARFVRHKQGEARTTAARSTLDAL